MLRAIACPDAPVAARLAPSGPAAAPEPTGARRPALGWRVRQRLTLLRNGSYLVPLWARLARALGLAVAYTELHGRLLRADGTVTELGLLGRKLVTNAGVNYLAADMAGGSNDINLFRFHGIGTGTTAESASDTALVTELTTQYATDNTRPTGSQASSTNTYTTVGTISPDSGGTLAITEHGLFTQAATGGGTLWDRTVFAAVNLVAGSDSLQVTHTTTFPSGG